eukprot:scaffold125236_cov44-Prasinocladus_malaysianus.AAC.2
MYDRSTESTILASQGGVAYSEKTERLFQTLRQHIYLVPVVSTLVVFVWSRKWLMPFTVRLIQHAKYSRRQAPTLAFWRVDCRPNNISLLAAA